MSRKLSKAPEVVPHAHPKATSAISLSVRFCTDQEDASEDKGLLKAINAAKISKEDVTLFDRGISSAHTFNHLHQQQIHFITRVNPNRRYQSIAENPSPSLSKDENIHIEKDLMVYLFNKNNKEIPCPLRLIQAMNCKEEPLWFLTNLLDLSAFDSASLYKRRWDIEVFFKFIKQHLHMNHFLSHTQHGMQIYLTMLPIVALLLMMFKAKTKQPVFKRPLYSFTLNVQKFHALILVKLSGGDLNKIRHLI